ncbi:hypothetical protein OIV83_006031 [Microbotryomycetes sp. JL201]|nr:hypothetical protein OIV83_006031 [Microbotryomycetes sp. JL201]
MLDDVTNRATVVCAYDTKDAVSAVTRVHPSSDLAWDGELLPSKLKLKRAMGESSQSRAGSGDANTRCLCLGDTAASCSMSSSPVAGVRSSSPFVSHRFAPYDAPTSPTADATAKPSSDDDPTAGASMSAMHAHPRAIAPVAAHGKEAAKPVASTPVTCLMPTKVYTHDQDEISLERRVAMQFGRKTRRRAVAVQPGDGVVAVHSVVMPKHAIHASRVHCIAQLKAHAMLFGRLALSVRVVGQNGMRLDGKRWRRGTNAVVDVAAGQLVEFDFYSWKQSIRIAPSEAPMTTPVPTPAPIPARQEVVLLNGDFSDSELADGRPNNPSSPALSALSDLASSPVRPPNRAMSSRAVEIQNRLSLDLPGLIASAIVFSPRSTVGVEEVCRALLREAGGMWDVLEDGRGSDEQSEEREDRAVEEWWDVVEKVMLEEPFFGRIDNAGLKDASGHPLLPAYFYVPDQDPSASRVEALEPFVKRVRGARTAKPVQYFWAKPSLRKNR